MDICEYESEIEGVIENHYLNLRDIDMDEANEFEKSMEKTRVISGSLEVMLMKLLDEYFEKLQEDICTNECSTDSCNKDCDSGYRYFSKVYKILKEKNKKCLS